MLFSLITKTPNKMYVINPFFEESMPDVLNDGNSS